MKNIVKNVPRNKMSYSPLKLDKNYKCLVRINKKHRMLNKYYSKHNLEPKLIFSKKCINAFSKTH